MITSTRVKRYPWIILIVILAIIGLNLIFHEGWRGGFGQIIGSDFITLYGSGVLYRSEVADLYDFEAQFAIQQQLIEPTYLSGVNPFISPPYVAYAYSLLTRLGLPFAFGLWELLTLVFVFLAIILMSKLIPEWLTQGGLDTKRLVLLVLSFFPFAIGWQVGQNHTLSMLLITGMVYCSVSRRWKLAGTLAGFLIFKPQFVVGFAILWVVWKKYSALIPFLAVSALWIGIPILQHGISPYLDYLEFGSVLMRLPSIEGFPASLLVTPYGFLSTVMPMDGMQVLRSAGVVLMIILSVAFGWYAYRVRKWKKENIVQVLVLCILFPLLATPYVMVHDLIMLFPGFILWSWISRHRSILYTAIFTYLGGLVFPILGHLSGVALLASIPVVFLAVFWWTNTNASDSHDLQIS